MVKGVEYYPILIYGIKVTEHEILSLSCNMNQIFGEKDFLTQLDDYYHPLMEKEYQLGIFIFTDMAHSFSDLTFPEMEDDEEYVLMYAIGKKISCPITDEKLNKIREETKHKLHDLFPDRLIEYHIGINIY